MKPKGDMASEILDQMSDLLNYELLVSTPGIKEADSNFMWAANFRAPVGINVIHEEVSFNLFLPEGAENDKDKKLFFSRVGAKLQDGLWQVRRIMSDLSEIYASIIKMALEQFSSVILDYSFIQEGRYYSHFTFNESDLAQISAVLISLTDVIQGYNIEYLRRLKKHIHIFNGVDEIEEVSTVTVEIYPSNTKSSTKLRSVESFFVMANYLNGGVKTVGITKDGYAPGILEPYDLSEVNGNIVSFKSKNKHVNELVKKIASNFIILYGIYGAASTDYLRIMLPLPRQQKSILIKVLNGVMNGHPDWNIKISEVSDFAQHNKD